jgi:hypothetical protein
LSQQNTKAERGRTRETKAVICCVAAFLQRLIEAGASTNAVITLIGFELPNWGTYAAGTRHSSLRQS